MIKLWIEQPEQKQQLFNVQDACVTSMRSATVIFKITNRWMLRTSWLKYVSEANGYSRKLHSICLSLFIMQRMYSACRIQHQCPSIFVRQSGESTDIPCPILSYWNFSLWQYYSWETRLKIPLGNLKNSCQIHGQ